MAPHRKNRVATRRRMANNPPVNTIRARTLP